MTASTGAVRRITLMRAGALGDTLLTLPTLALLRAFAPDARLTFIARGDMLPLVRANALADDLWPWDLPDWGAIFAPPGADLALTGRANAALAGADAVIVWAPDPAGEVAARLARLGVRQAIVAPAQPPSDLPAAPHTAVWLADALRPLGVTPPTSPAPLAAQLAPLRAPAEAIAEAETLWRRWGLGRRAVALHPGSGSPAKRWPAERFAEVARLARDAGYQPLLLAGEADAQALAEAQAALAQLGVQTSVAQGLRLATVAALLARCAGYIGCDSGVTHLAGLVGAPTVAVFGPTDPARWAPLGLHAHAAQAPGRRLGQLAAGAVWATLAALMGDPGAA